MDIVNKANRTAIRVAIIAPASIALIMKSIQDSTAKVRPISKRAMSKSSIFFIPLFHIIRCFESFNASDDEFNAV